MIRPDSPEPAPADARSGRYPRVDRDLSWLAFNHRVLREAADPDVPLFDRLGFLAIFSSNLDEFFRVRVASLRARVRSGEGGRAAARQAAELLQRIRQTAVSQQEEFGGILRREVLPALASEGIRFVYGGEVPEEVRAEAARTFHLRIAPALEPALLTSTSAPFLRNRSVYLVARLGDSAEASSRRYGVIEIPTGRVPRFWSFSDNAGGCTVLFTDDVIRLHMAELFPGEAVGAVHAVKLSRDAELYLEEELTSVRSEAIRRSLAKRETGLPARFLYDRATPPGMVRDFRDYLGLAEADLVDGGRYHNLHDLHGFPRCGRDDLVSQPLAPLPHPQLSCASSVLSEIAAGDRILHLPYQEYEPVLRFLREAAADPTVEEVWATLYRVAPDSAVVQALVEAARAGKRVTAIVEVQARFDEAANLAWAEHLEQSGVRTIHGVAGLKVHAKLLLVVRRRGTEPRRFACLSTGNFNERTARAYSDHLLFTSHPELAREVHELFRYMAGEMEPPAFRHLLVAPFDLRVRFEALLAREEESARSGEPARVVLKLNSLQDPRMIDRLYAASQAGVQLILIVRGICCLVAGVPGLSANVQARSIVDRYLEHGRIYLFHAGGGEPLYLASADLMTRNLDHRIEVAFPVLDPEAKAQLRAILRLQLDDDRKSRHLVGVNPDPSPYLGGRRRAQSEIRRFLEALAPDAALPGSDTVPESTSGRLDRQANR